MLTALLGGTRTGSAKPEEILKKKKQPVNKVSAQNQTANAALKTIKRKFIYSTVRNVDIQPDTQSLHGNGTDSRNNAIN